MDDGRSCSARDLAAGTCRVADSDIKAVNLRGDKLHPEWNYIVKPKH
jgi:hypothetical protein